MLLEDLRPLVSSGTCIYPHTLSQGYYCWMKHHDQSNFGKKVFVLVGFHITVYHQRDSEQLLKESRNLETGVDTKTMEEDSLLACLLACFLIESKTTRPGVAPPIMDWDLPRPTLIKKMTYSWIL